MPVYHARSITVRLGSMPLGETTTSDVVLKKGEVAKRQSEAAEKKLLGSGYLAERRVLFPGDRDGFELNWLGNTPFMQTQVDTGFLQSPGSYAGNQGQAYRTSEQNRLQALALHVKLSDKAFLSGFSGKTHLKIEVLFNGQLSTCSLIHTNDIRSGAKSLNQTFAGYRVGFLAERPWILLPPHTNADGGTRRFRKTITPTERWREVSAAVQKEAEERGTDKYGGLPPSATFLHALASMEMPESVPTMQKPGGRKFGIIDVIITAGYGNKFTTGTSYLKRPQRLKDSNYAVRAEIRSDDEVAAAEPDDSQDTTDKHVDETEADVTRNEAGGIDSDAIDERPRKRRAFSSVKGLPQPSPKKSDFHSPFLSGQVSALPPAQQTFSSSLSPIAGTVSPRCPSPEHRSDGHKQPLPANDHNRTYSMTCKSDDMHEWKNNASRISQEYHCSPPDPEWDALRAGSANPALTCMTASQSSFPNGPNGVTRFAGSPMASSPLPHLQGYYTSPPPQLLYFDQVDAPNALTHLGPSTPFVAPTTLMLPTPLKWPAPSSAITPPYHYPVSVQQPPQLSSFSYPPAYMPPNGLPDFLPQTPPLHPFSGPAQSTTPVMSSSPLIQPRGQLPPTAMFSVPSKPRRSLSPDKGAAKSKPDVSSNNITISRLVITGRGGKLIVDNTWSTPQRIGLATGHFTFGEGQAKQFTLQQRASFADHSAYERKDAPNNSFSATSRATAPIKRLHTESTKKHAGEQRRDSVVEPALEVQLPYLKRHQEPTNESPPVNPRIDVPDRIALFVPARILAVATPALVPMPVHTPRSASPTQPIVSQRRTFSRNPLPGIQGPKTATFLFDDPEEVLREAARMRRSRSPTKPAATPIVLSTTPIARNESTTDPDAQGSSSPLSSVPSSPLSEKPADVLSTAGAASTQIPQLDGSPERTIPATSPRKLLTPLPKKPALPTPKLQHPGPNAPQKSISPNAKERKASQLLPTRPPRSPDRLKTVDNPPLNDDCVIALAESIDKQEERGVLRQVKGERQGMFKEEYVVLAVRFFVAGD
ncbi:hypothetical protein E8E11_004889 [Didymella keratinophila]|nr:hypothetical protein E8E11_004889 [Didymella keratinophila]